MMNVPFLPLVPNTVAVPKNQAECIDNDKTLIHRHSPLILYWCYIIHKYQEKTLDIAVIDLRKSESALASR